MERVLFVIGQSMGAQPMESATMFRGMQQVLNKMRKKSDEAVTEEPGVIAINPAITLLATERRQQIIQELKSIINLSDADFDKVFMSVINNFAEFVQDLPETQTSYFAHQGGMLDYSLERTVMTMHMCSAYLTKGDQTLASVSAYEMLWAYAVFTASLLLDIGIIASKHFVTLYDEADNFIKNWSPYAGSMLGQGVGYRFEFLQENLDHLQHLIAPILARQIMPVGDVFDDSENDGAISESSLPSGFLSIASEPKILEAWLAIFTGDSRATGTLLSIIQIIKAQMSSSIFIEGKTTNFHLTPTMLAFLEKLKTKRFGLDPKAIKEQGKPIKRTEIKPPLTRSDIQPAHKFESAPSKAAFDTTPQAEAIGQFFKWIEQGIASGKLSANQADSHIQVLSEKEAMILPNLLEIYVKEIKGSKFTPADVKALQQQLNNAPAELITHTVIEVNSSQFGEINQTLMMVNPLLILPASASIGLITEHAMAHLDNFPANVVAAIKQQYGPMIVPNTMADTLSGNPNPKQQSGAVVSVSAPINNPVNVPTYSPGSPKAR